MPRRTRLLFVADLFGSARAVSAFRQGQSFTFSLLDLTDVPRPEADRPSAEDVRRQNIRDILITLDTYEDSRRFTAKELFALRKIWLEGWSLERVACAEGVTRQAIRERIAGNRKNQGGILKKAPEFAAWWRTKHRHRTRRRKA